MSERDDTRGGRFEPRQSLQPGEGQALTGRCDECQLTVAVRHPAKVLRGPLRGLRGMVCRACKDLRKATTK